MERIVADFAGLVEFEQAAIRTIDELEKQYSDLRARIAPVCATWTGEAASAYQSRQQEWDNAAADLRDALKELHRIVRTARGNYSAVLRANLAMWRRD